MSSDTEQRSNIVFIFSNDFGYAGLGCFGAHDIKTPNIEKIRNDGIKFTEFYSAPSVYSSSRFAFPTVRLPQQMKVILNVEIFKIIR